MSHGLNEALLKQLNVSRESLERLKTFVSLLITWQASINLIAPSTVDIVWKRHVLDSLQLLALMKPDTNVIADLGSGAGFPGMVLAIAGGFETHLYESNGKKAAFLQEAQRQTKTNVVVHQVRLETLCDHLPVARPDYVTARALAPLSKLLEWAYPMLRLGAVGLFHKGQDVDSELAEATQFWKIGARKHPSMTDSGGTILEVMEVSNVG